MKIEHAQLPLWVDRNLAEKMDLLRKLTYDLYRYSYQDSIIRMEEILDQFIPYDDVEKSAVETIKATLNEHPNIFLKSCEIGHFTGSALIIDMNSGRFLLHYHKKLFRWLQFGGHSELETDMSLVALRETKEETGIQDLDFFPNSTQHMPIDIEVQLIIQNKSQPEHYHFDFRYILITNEPQNLATNNSNESQQFQWFSFSEPDTYPKDLDPCLHRLILKAGMLYTDYLG